MATAPCAHAPPYMAVGRPKILPLAAETQVITRSLAEIKGTFVWCLRREERARAGLGIGLSLADGSVYLGYRTALGFWVVTVGLLGRVTVCWVTGLVMGRFKPGTG
ncbi:Exodeoxyribonuclease V beta chain [Gossypium arboreum]|uniref:Exodeoxyribonuclease V beta chain n=1 Tax=Gossypium arboreum TaxID=29729 RepID=A0A0B0NER0_GOSAR|nr:Exodeoxyribonuclease V beta chain [Gossypium arboreum]